MRKVFLLLVALRSFALLSQTTTDAIRFTVSMAEARQQIFQVSMDIPSQAAGRLLLKMPVWTPGYYQRLNYADHLRAFSAKTSRGTVLPWKKIDDNTWEIEVREETSVQVRYAIEAKRAFVATPYLDTTRAYIVPAALCLFPAGRISVPVSIELLPVSGWNRIATGLEPDAKQANRFTASNYDILYDSPLLMGKLDTLPSFAVKGVPHHFVGYRIGQFDASSFITDLQALTTAAADLMGDIPFTHYSFIGIGPGQGGIEHLNSTTISFNGNGLGNRNERLRLLNFIAHEYFHHYNAKRIRPFEFGPFDYDHGNRSTQLWIAEGLTVYYEYLILRRAGITSEEELLKSISGNIRAHEMREGKMYQSLVQASYDTWSDGPFGRTGDGAKKTISYYDKGPVVGLLLDFTIRQLTQNRQSLDDVMRRLYTDYYQERERGFTDAEFRQVCESVAGTSLAEFFDYVYTVKELDYDTVLSYAGIRLNRESWQLEKMDGTDSLQHTIWHHWSRTKE